MKSTTENTENTTPDFGNGRLSALAKECYRDARRTLKLSEKQAERFVRVFLADYGRISHIVDAQGVRIGNPVKSREMAVTVREVSIAKDVRLTYSMKLFKLIQELQKAKSYGVEDYTVVKLTADLNDWLNETGEFAKPTAKDNATAPEALIKA
jgi:hypothetical protein